MSSMTVQGVATPTGAKAQSATQPRDPYDDSSEDTWAEVSSASFGDLHDYWGQYDGEAQRREKDYFRALKDILDNLLIFVSAWLVVRLLNCKLAGLTFYLPRLVSFPPSTQASSLYPFQDSRRILPPERMGFSPCLFA